MPSLRDGYAVLAEYADIGNNSDFLGNPLKQEKR